MIACLEIVREQTKHSRREVILHGDFQGILYSVIYPTLIIIFITFIGSKYPGIIRYEAN